MIERHSAKQLSVFVLNLLLVLLVIYPHSSAECDPFEGPPGETLCRRRQDGSYLLDLKPDIYQYPFQLATCVSNEYIEQKTSGEVTCKDTSSFCSVPCELELFDYKDRYNDSEVCPKDCRLRTTIRKQELPSDCVSPTGNDCTWYRRCLAVQYPCGDQAGYAIGYGEKYCNLYEQRLPLFSEKGQAWIGAVRKCLQVQLVPLLRLYTSEPYSCAKVKEIAFLTHAQCYLNPYQGPSVCDLSYDDFWKIYHTVKPILKTDFLVSVDGVRIMMSCFNPMYIRKPSTPLGLQIDGDNVNTVYLEMGLQINASRDSPRWKRSISQTVNSNEVADAVMTSLATQLGWCSNIGWYAHMSREIVTEGRWNSLVLFLSDLQKLGLGNLGCSEYKRSLNEEIQNLKKAITQGLIVSLPDMNLSIGIASMSSCSPQLLYTSHCASGSIPEVLLAHNPAMVSLSSGTRASLIYSVNSGLLPYVSAVIIFCRLLVM